MMLLATELSSGLTWCVLGMLVGIIVAEVHRSARRNLRHVKASHERQLVLKPPTRY